MSATESRKPIRKPDIYDRVRQLDLDGKLPGGPEPIEGDVLGAIIGSIGNAAGAAQESRSPRPAGSLFESLSRSMAEQSKERADAELAARAKQREDGETMTLHDDRTEALTPNSSLNAKAAALPRDVVDRALDLARDADEWEAMLDQELEASGMFSYESNDEVLFAEGFEEEEI